MARVRPFGQRVVEAHPQSIVAHRRGQLLHDVAVRTACHAVPFGLEFAVPQTVAVVVLGDEDHISRTGILEKFRPIVGIPKFCVPIFCEFLVLVEDGLGGVGVIAHDAHPFGLFLHQPAVEPLAVALFRGVGGHGVESPVDEDAEFRVLEPLWVAALVEGFPGGLHKTETFRQ